MAKINARGARQIGPTFYTERTRPATDYDVERVYYEAYRLRSDGSVLTRIIRTWPLDPTSGEHTTEHSSGFRILGRLATGQPAPDSERLRRWLERKGFTIVKESFR